MATTRGTLAIHDGEPAVTTDDPEQWERPVEAEKAAVNELIEDGFLSGSGRGPPLAFEEAFGEYAGADYCVTVDHGSTAIQSALYAVGVGPGDEVITPTAGYLGAYAGALHLGARPVFCEVDPDTLLADPADVEQRITDRTAAVLITHFNGRVCDMDAFRALGDEYDVPIVVDAAHAHGSRWDGEHVGSVGDVACFSLQGVAPSGKPIAAGEGGVVTTNDEEYHQRQLAYCHLHRSGVNDELTLPEYADLDFEVLGNKWRAHPLALAIAGVHLDTLESRVERRLAFRYRLFDRLEGTPGLRLVRPYEQSETDGLYGGLRAVYRPDELDGLPVETFVEALQAEGAPVDGPGFSYVEHRRTIFREGFDLWGDDRGPLGGEWCGLPPFGGYADGDFPVTEDLHDRVLTLPSYVDPADGFVDEFGRAVEKVVENCGSLS